jgi:putative membrane protein
MIRYNPHNWFGLIFRFHKSDTLSQLWWEIAILILYTAGLAFLYEEGYAVFTKSTITIHSLIGFVIGLLLVFRTNSAYDRWWEGRKQWGSLLNVSRSIAVKFASWVPQNRTTEKEQMALLVEGFAVALREHLRNGVKENMIRSGVRHLAKKEHVPLAFIHEMSKIAIKLNREGILSNEQLMLLEKDFRDLSDILGACERIKNTPIPFSYSTFIKKVLFIYTLTLPIGFIPEFSYYTIFPSIFVFYVLVSFELLAEEIEDPFGNDANDIDTDGISAKISRNVQEVFGFADDAAVQQPTSSLP